MQSVSSNLAVILTAMVGAGLAVVLTNAQLDQFGWRIALVLSASIVPFTLIVRRTLKERLVPVEPNATRMQQSFRTFLSGRSR